MMRAAAGVAAGSGLGLRALLDEVHEERPFASFEGLSAVSVEGHRGRFLIGRCAGRPLILQEGRLHVYEGLSPSEVGRTVDALVSLGAERILFTNAAGGLRPEMAAGGLMAAERIETWFYLGWPNRPEALDLDFQMPGCPHTGTYMWVPGPSYETRAEIRALQSLGCAAVGMSAAPEVARCKELGIPAGAVSCITNNCLDAQKLTHEHVLEIAARASSKLCALIRAGRATLFE